MKVKEIIARIADMKKCIEYLNELSETSSMDTCRKDAIVEDIEAHLDNYCEMLESMEVRWNERAET